MNAIFDSHAHYDDASFDEDRDALLAALPQKNVCGVLCAATCPESACRCLALAEAYPHVWASVGLHPSELDQADAQAIETFRRLYAHPKVVAVGEIGLDYHYDTFPREKQREWFRRQLELAAELDAPVIVHDREAHEDTMKLLREFRPRGVVHCFSGSVELMREVMQLGMSISLGGAVTFKNARRPLEVAAEVPLDRLLLETDAPYMTPVPFRGKRCDSTHIAYTAAQIASVRGIGVDELLACTTANALRLFGIRLPA